MQNIFLENLKFKLYEVIINKENIVIFGLLKQK